MKGKYVVSCNIQEVIDFLTERMNEGYKTVELIDKRRAAGWICIDPKLNFIFNEHSPTTVGIDAMGK